MKEKIIEINGEKIRGEIVESYYIGTPKQIIFDGNQKINSPIGELECKHFVNFFEDGKINSLMITEQRAETTIKGVTMTLNQEYIFDRFGILKEIKFHLIKLKNYIE